MFIVIIVITRVARKRIGNIQNLRRAVRTQSSERAFRNAFRTQGSNALLFRSFMTRDIVRGPPEGGTRSTLSSWAHKPFFRNSSRNSGAQALFCIYVSMYAYRHVCVCVCVCVCVGGGMERAIRNARSLERGTRTERANPPS